MIKLIPTTTIDILFFIFIIATAIVLLPHYQDITKQGKDIVTDEQSNLLAIQDSNDIPAISQVVSNSQLPNLYDSLQKLLLLTYAILGVGFLIAATAKYKILTNKTTKKLLKINILYVIAVALLLYIAQFIYGFAGYGATASFAVLGALIILTLALCALTYYRQKLLTKTKLSKWSIIAAANLLILGLTLWLNMFFIFLVIPLLIIINNKIKIKTISVRQTSHQSKNLPA